MGYCLKCGSELPEGAVFCPKCGANVTPTQAVKLAAKTSTGRNLILAGGVIAVIASLWALIMSTFWTSMIDTMMLYMMLYGFPIEFFSFIRYFLFFGAIISLVAGILAIYEASIMRKSFTKNSSIIAIIAGGVLLISGNLLAAILVILGGFLAYSSRKGD